MQFSLQQKADVLVLRVEEAKLTYPLLSSFLSAVTDLVSDGTRKLVIDLAVVTYIDSSTIGCLMQIHRLLEAHGGSVKLAGLQRRVDTMLAMAGVKKIVEVCRDEAEAVGTFLRPDEASGGGGGAAGAAPDESAPRRWPSS
jgi:anti-sigma B factor antagonist